MMKCGYSLGVIILAAGESKRMGTPKPLLKLGGKSFLERILSCEYLKKCNIHPIVILGHKAKLICENITLTYPWELNKYYLDGRITSVQLGLRMLPETLDGVFIWPVDCPLVPQDVLETLEQQFTGSSSILVPCFNNRRGHPPLIGSAFFSGNYGTQAVAIAEGFVPNPSGKSWFLSPFLLKPFWIILTHRKFFKWCRNGMN